MDELVLDKYLKEEEKKSKEEMKKFYICKPEDIELFKTYKAYVKGSQPFSIKKSFLEKIRDKFSSMLKKEFEHLYYSGLDYVEGSTIDKFYDKKIKSVDDEINDVNSKRGEVVRENAESEKVVEKYVVALDEKISELQRKKIILIVDKSNPHKVSFFVLPKIVVLQLKKNMGKKLDTLNSITDEFLNSLTKKLSDTQVIYLLKLLKKRLDEKNLPDKDDPMFGPPVDPNPVDDYIVEVSDKEPKKR